MTIYSDTIFSGVRYSPVFTNGITRHLAVKVPTIYAVRADRKEIVACANLASARAYASGRLPEKVEDETTFTYSCKAFVSPTGQYYVEALAGSQNVRIDVANAQTARYYVRNGIDTELVNDAFLSSFNQ